MKQTTEEFKKDFALVTKMGADAFHAGIMAAPAMDVNFSAVMKKYSSPDFSGSKQLIKLMTAWSNAWHAENLK
jgi:hypothetical protein